MKKGNIVTVHAELYTIYEHPDRYVKTQEIINSSGLYKWEIIHIPFAFSGVHVNDYNYTNMKLLIKKIYLKIFQELVIGKTYLATGIREETKHSFYEDGDYDYDPPYLREDRRHSCWLVEPIDNGDRLLQPIHCLEEDLSAV